MSLTSDQKLDVLIVLFAIWLLVFILSVAFKLKLFVSGKDPSKCIERLNIRDNKGDYSGMLEIANWFLEQQPENADIKWAKGRALFKLQKYEEAKAVFQEIATTEPLWKSEANQYIEAIIEKNT
jgi:tetratricopeptide (TPR) repeat protein